MNKDTSNNYSLANPFHRGLSLLKYSYFIITITNKERILFIEVTETHPELLNIDVFFDVTIKKGYQQSIFVGFFRSFIKGITIKPAFELTVIYNNPG